MMLSWILMQACSTASKIDTGVTIDDTAPPSEDTAVEEPIEPFCGDGVLDPDEECDDGENNSDTLGNACRLNCTLPYCGDGIWDDLSEECDDGNFWDVDGCGQNCLLEEGYFEVEPNSNPSQAQLLNTTSIQGSLWEGDMDCFTVPLEENDYARFWVSGHAQSEDAEGNLIDSCLEALQLSVYQNGAVSHVEYPLVDGDCVSLSYSTHSEMRFLEAESDTVVCVEGFLSSAVSSYTLNWEVFSDSCTLEDITFTQEEDPDFDLLANNCDEDDDNDGLTDDQDNCPVNPNNGPVSYYVSPDGFIRDWLILGPIPGLSTSGCQAVAGMTTTAEADIVPDLGLLEPFVDGNDYLWQLYQSPDDRINFLNHTDLGQQAAPREVFAAIWIYSDQDYDSQILLGPDDGAKVWFNGVFVGETTNCQGTSIDRYSYDAPIQTGWNRLLIQVRDGGGGWGLYARFAENGTPLTGFLLSPVAYGFLDDQQLDSDGDGIGDQCDQ